MWALNDSNFNPRILYLEKLLLYIDGELKIFHNKQKLKQYMISKLPLPKILQGILHTEDEIKQNHKKVGSIKQQKKKRKGIRQ
jgi:hypothetical protein